MELYSTSEARKLSGLSPNGFRDAWRRLEIIPVAQRYGDTRQRFWFTLEQIEFIRKNTRNYEHKVSNKERIDKYGYVNIYRPHHPRSRTTGEVYKHILVMEESLGRFLLDNEVVHHVDGDKSNNELSNLKLYNNQGEHLRQGHKLNQLIQALSEENKEKVKAYVITLLES